MSLGLVITLGIWFVGFVFFLLYWLGEEAKSSSPIPAAGFVVTFFALFWPGVMAVNILWVMCIGIGWLFRGLGKRLTRLGEKLYEKMNGGEE